jgi:hypothetical protein
MTLSPSLKAKQSFYACLTRRVERFLELDVQRACTKAAAVHRAQHLNLLVAKRCFVLKRLVGTRQGKRLALTILST